MVVVVSQLLQQHLSSQILRNTKTNSRRNTNTKTIRRRRNEKNQSMATGRECAWNLTLWVSLTCHWSKDPLNYVFRVIISDHKDFSDKKHKDKEKMKHKDGSTDKYKDKYKEKRKEEKVNRSTFCMVWLFQWLVRWPVMNSNFNVCSYNTRLQLLTVDQF